MLTKSTTLKFYKQKFVQDAIIEHAQRKEIGVRYNEIFGKRPDILQYPREVLELALRDATSFHCSEELWENPTALSSELSRKELDALRVGWDLMLDIDCIDWELSKLTTSLFIKALQENGVKDVSCKFSGNKGFHIGVPFEAFPSTIGGQDTKILFPLAAQKISQYLLDLITKKLSIKNNTIFFTDKYNYTLEELKEKFGEKEFIINSCKRCKNKIKFETEDNSEFICPRCEKKEKVQKTFIKCDKCNILMKKIENKKTLCECGSNEYNSNFNPASILEVDTVLISSRHLYRMPYSLHEKSGLVSLPIDPENVLEFEKPMAKPEVVLVPRFIFLDRNVSGESARQLLVQALDFNVKMAEEPEKQSRQYDEMTIECPITEEFFPPCMQSMLNGMEDGKKRAVFCLMNFLGKIGWSKPEIELFLKKWNTEKNRVPLREVYLKGQLNHFKPGERLPPNCDNDAYYKSMGVACSPDSHCQRFKNPVNYTLAKWRRRMREKEEEEGKGKRKKKKETDQIISKVSL